MQTLRIAIPLFGTRVAPRFRHATEILLAHIVSGRVVMKKVVPTMEMGMTQRLNFLADREVDTLVCGGLDPSFLESAVDMGIRVVNNVAGEAGEVLNELAAGTLESWRGYACNGKPGETAAAHAQPRLVHQDNLMDLLERDGPQPDGLPDCTRCTALGCLRGEDCLGIRTESLQLVRRDPMQRHTEMAGYVNTDAIGAMSRVEEMLRFCEGMEYDTIGLAFCADLAREARILAALLRRRFRVAAVSCKVGGLDKSDCRLPRGSNSSFEPACNPMGQALVMHQQKCDFVVSMGLCMGFDVVLHQALKPPCTSLIVKDRVLANNPSAALFSQFHLRNIVGNE